MHGGGNRGWLAALQEGDQDLYWSTGDGGGQLDPENNGQDTGNLLGSIIRISVSPTEGGYRIPGGNVAGEELHASLVSSCFSSCPWLRDDRKIAAKRVR